MTPKAKIANDTWKMSGISRKYPTYRYNKFISNENWLKCKQIDDEAEGLWRIKDKLYDLTDFIDRHPGGRFWIEVTKGTDITEPFESHHISTLPEKILGKYEVRTASQPRNYTLTLHENGFYMTLKRRVRDRLQQLNYKKTRKTEFFHLSLLISLLIFSVVAVRTGVIIFNVLSGLSLCWLGIAAHNFFHQKDNWQMYTFNLTLLNFVSWRVSHALSHHVYPNSLYDLEMSLFEPFLCWVPNKRYANKLQRIISVIISPFVYTIIFFLQIITRLVYSLINHNIMHWHDLIGLALPSFMWIATGAPLLQIVYQWLFIVMLGSFLFSLIGITAAHHDPKIYHEGDATREDRDWGLFQVDTIIDRCDIKGSDFLVLTHFGEHVMHHLFPTLDHGVLKKLYPELLQTLKEFRAELRETNHLDHIIGQTKQLLRMEPNPYPPGSKKCK